MKLEDMFKKIYMEAEKQGVKIVEVTKGDRYSKQHYLKSFLKRNEISGVIVMNPGRKYEICEIHLYNHNIKFRK